ncbi:MAG: hypothetical protein B7Z47_06095, partial [Chthoniobacter sp. 12-60-6]
MFLWIMCGMIAGVLVQSFRIALGKKRYRSEAQFIVAGNPSDLDACSILEASRWAGTIIEAITSDMLSARALERVRALHPELKAQECEVVLKASQVKESGLFQLCAMGSDNVFIRHYLDALMDEYVCVRREVRHQRQARFFGGLFDAFEIKRNEAAKAANSPGSRRDVEEVYTELMEQLIS